MLKIKNMNNKGFTLVELLIVVAIIGILSTVGIPTFKKMVQKSKKSEAKVGLGGLYTAEVAFFSEYGVYGSFLDKIGFDMGGAPGAGGTTYTIGFPVAACTQDAIMPKAAATSLDTVYPTYFTAAYIGVLPATTRPPGVGACEVSTRADLGTTFIATATGAISPAAVLTVPGDMDTWTINPNRALTNVKDGVK